MSPTSDEELAIKIGVEAKFGWARIQRRASNPVTLGILRSNTISCVDLTVPWLKYLPDQEPIVPIVFCV